MPTIQGNYAAQENKSTVYHFLAVPQDKKLLYYATSCGRETWSRAYFQERKDINIYMLNYIRKGRAQLIVNGEAFELYAGDFTFLYLGEHSVLSCTEDDTEIVFFHVLGAQIEALYNAFLQRGQYVLHRVPQELVCNAFAAFEEHIGAENGFYAQSRILYGLLMEILHLRSSEKQQTYPKLIDRILCHILYTCPPPSPSEVAAQFGFSQIYLERMFKRYVGECMRTYILRQKYAFACRFLTDTDMTVEEVAHRVGYNDTKGLIVLFKKFSTLTPLAYRKQLRK